MPLPYKKAAFVLVNGNLTYNPTQPGIDTDLRFIEYELLPSPVPISTKPRKSFAEGGGGCSSFCPSPLGPLDGEGKPEFLKIAVALLSGKVKKTEADLFPPAKKRKGSEEKKSEEIRRLKDRLKKLSEEAADLRKKAEGVELDLLKRIEGLEERIEILNRLASDPLVLQAGLTFESVLVLRDNQGAVFSGQDAERLLLLVKSSRARLTSLSGIAVAGEVGRFEQASAVALAKRAPELRRLSTPCASALGKLRTAVETKGKARLVLDEVEAVHGFLSADLEARNLADQAMGWARTEALVGIGAGAAFSVFVALVAKA